MELSYGSTDYEAAEKTFHFFRRRRWIRQRKNVSGIKSNVIREVIQILLQIG